MLFQISLLTGIIPPISIIYWLMWKYENLFDEKKLFLYMVLGFMLGIIFSLFFILLSYSMNSYLDLSVIFVLFFALLIELVKYVIMARKRVVKDYRMLFYGSSLGVGIAGTFVTGLEYRYFLQRETFHLEDIIGFALLSSSMSITQLFCGFYISKAIATQSIIRYFSYAYGLHSIYNISLLPYIWNFHIMITAAFTTPFLFLILLVHTTVLNSLPKDIAKRLKKKEVKINAKK